MAFETFIPILISSFVATSVMTLFSYILSESFKELYKEPVLLSYCLTALAISLSSKAKNVLGWLIHYAIGFLFVLGYYLIWENEIMNKTWTTALILGVISGIIGIVSWLLIFKISGYKPKIDFKGYYLQLFFVHILFGLSAFTVYILF